MPDIKCLFLAKKDKSLYQKNCVIGLLSSLGMTFPFLEYDGRITIIKKVKGSSDGILKNIKANKIYSDRQSLEATVSKKHTVRQVRKHVA